MNTTDKTGEALKAQRFQMLQDIAEELSGEVIFPTSFNLVMRLREVLQDPNWQLDQLTSVLSIEPLISAKLVGLANSAAFNTGVKVVEVSGAVQRLGLNKVRSLAMAVALDQLRRAKNLSAFSDVTERLWSHSLRTASAAYILARKLTRFNADEALLAGMIHDIGAFYMLYRAAQYNELLERPESVKYLITQWHESIGHTLLLALGMPEEIADAVRDHDQPRPPPTFLANLTDIIYVANLLAGGMFEWQYQDAQTGAEQIAVLDSKFQVLIPEIDAHEAQMQAVFG